MPITKSAKKALRQNKARKNENYPFKKKMKELIKKTKFLVSEKKTDEAKDLLPEIYKSIDKSVKKGVIKKNTGDRKKSRLTKLIIANSSNK